MRTPQRAGVVSQKEDCNPVLLCPPSQHTLIVSPILRVQLPLTLNWEMYFTSGCRRTVPILKLYTLEVFRMPFIFTFVFFKSGFWWRV